jgi:DoxX-like protein
VLLHDLIGVWYVLGGVALLVPRFPRLKEWAYAGLVFIYTRAVASHLAVGDPAVTLVAPINLYRAGGRLLGTASAGTPRPVSRCESNACD